MNVERVSKTISDWICERARESGAKGVVVGLSGGVDSAVVLALSRRALGQAVLGLIMPCGSGAQDEQDALELGRALDVKTATVPLDEPYRKLLAILPSGSEMAKANLKARLRMLTIYFYANSLNYLVAGTGNRSELAVGYFTKYGDGAVDILPIGALLKRQVWELARGLGIPERIVQKAPSAGLWPGQTDEDELGLSYEVLDSTIESLEGHGQPEAPAEVVARVQKIMATSDHKRRPPPVCDVRVP